MSGTIPDLCGDQETVSPVVALKVIPASNARCSVGAEVQAEVTLHLASRMGMQVTEVHLAPA
jgi:hypothetical protein